MAGPDALKLAACDIQNFVAILTLFSFSLQTAMGQTEMHGTRFCSLKIYHSSSAIFKRLFPYTTLTY
jgi:hypothetical protein